MLTVKEFAIATGAGVSTVNVWCRQGKLPGAYQQLTPFGAYWVIPASLVVTTKPRSVGRPKGSNTKVKPNAVKA